MITVAVCLVGSADTAKCASERLVLFPTWLLLDLLGVLVMLSTLGYEHL